MKTDNMSMLRRMWNRLFDRLVERRIKDVESWDGSSSRWPDADAYCADCLIDVNAAAGRSEKGRSHCKLPIREPGDAGDTYVRQAIYAAAGGRGITRVEKPDDVSQEDWDAAVTRAANRLISLYEEMDETAPESVYELAGKEAPARARNGDARHERAMSLLRLHEYLWDALNGPETPPDEWAWPVNVYLEGDGLFVVTAQGGRLYRRDIRLEGEDVILGEPVQVTEAFPAVGEQRGAFTVRRQADGRHRWLMVAATAVLNRVGEIDSTELFDSFIRHAEETGEYPRLDFYHLGDEDPDTWEFGQADYLARDGVCYVATGLFDEDHPLARATIAASQREPGRWGASIEFRARGGPEQIAADPDVRIPVYRAGVNTHISVVLEMEAAGWYTTLGVSQEVTRMRDDIMEKLRELFGDDEDGLEAFAAGVDDVNRTVAEEGLIHRTQGDEAETDEPDEAEAEAATLPLHEEDFDALVEIIAESEMVRTLIEQVTTLTTTVTELTGQTAELAERLTEAAERERTATGELDKLGRRLTALERSDEEKQREWLADLPPRRGGGATYRPRGQEQDEDEGDELSAEDIRAKTLAMMRPV
ncbi:MAG: hypothetical protein QM346_18760 [Chloroflexota bacterium]|nr:hypothetical protein [Chloroflexota bacterium]